MSHYILADFQPAIIALIVLVALLFIGALVFIFFKTRPKKDKPEEQASAENTAETSVEELSEQPETVEVNEEVAEELPEEVTEEQPEETEEVIEEEPEPVEEAEEQPEGVEEVTDEAETLEETEPEEAPEEAVEEAKSEEVKASVLPDGEDEPDTADDDNDADDDAPVRSVARTDGRIRYIIIKYNKSFTAKLIQSADGVKNYYSEIKNELLSYKGVKSRISWKYESFTAGRVTLAKIAVRGKNLALFLALDPKKYVDTKYIIDDKSEVAAYEKTPLLYRIKNDRRLNYSKELIETVMDGREKQEDYKAEDYAKEYPYEKIEPLIDRALVKVLTEEDAQSGDVFKPRDAVTASEVNELLQDEIAVALIEESEDVSDRTKQGIVNIDTLSRYFSDGETADLEEMKTRIPKFVKSTTYVKVLARGTLDKKLTVIADSFSIEAAKMILLTGGNAVKKKNS
ncbi:MAG: uL15 family ribosomal protein [Clostridia bacterium]|nr:uL15 family ribosomal protein [Clostridia bacterium]